MTSLAAIRGMLRRDALPPNRRAEHYMGMPATTHRWTVEEVRAMQDEERAWPRYELIDGELIVTPSPRMLHQIGVTELLLVLDPFVRRTTIGRVLSSPADIELVKGTIVQPDVFVVPLLEGRRPREWPDVKSLLLAIEIVSPSSSRVDRVTKRRFFAGVPVDEYWVVDLDARFIERTRVGEQRPEILDQELTWHPQGGPEPLVIDLPGFFSAVHADHS
jgi:Uma2 family endonuclease